MSNDSDQPGRAPKNRYYIAPKTPPSGPPIDAAKLVNPLVKDVWGLVEPLLKQAGSTSRYSTGVSRAAILNLARSASRSIAKLPLAFNADARLVFVDGTPEEQEVVNGLLAVPRVQKQVAHERAAVARNNVGLVQTTELLMSPVELPTPAESVYAALRMEVVLSPTQGIDK